jgi:hypothetical protein
VVDDRPFLSGENMDFDFSCFKKDESRIREGVVVQSEYDPFPFYKLRSAEYGAYQKFLDKKGIANITNPKQRRRVICEGIAKFLFLGISSNEDGPFENDSDEVEKMLNKYERFRNEVSGFAQKRELHEDIEVDDFDEQEEVESDSKN